MPSACAPSGERGRAAVSSFACPRPGCGHTTKSPALAALGYCEECCEFTGLCDAATIAVAPYGTGLVRIPDWLHPYTRVGAQRWRMNGADGVETDIVVWVPHGDRLRGGAAWMQARRPRLAFLGTCSRNGGLVRACPRPLARCQPRPPVPFADDVLGAGCLSALRCWRGERHFGPPGGPDLGLDAGMPRAFPRRGHGRHLRLFARLFGCRNAVLAFCATWPGPLASRALGAWRPFAVPA